MIIYTILFGMSTFKWNYSEYVTMLSVMGFLTGATLFCWIVVFTFRKNLLMVAKYSLAPTAQSTGSVYTYRDYFQMLSHLKPRVEGVEPKENTKLLNSRVQLFDIIPCFLHAYLNISKEGKIILIC